MLVLPANEEEHTIERDTHTYLFNSPIFGVSVKLV